MTTGGSRRAARTLKRLSVAAGLAAALGAVPLAAAGTDTSTDAIFTPGAAGLGDPYFPQAGNGGYDVAHYDLAVTYDPESDNLDGHVVITATATQNLASFNLDLRGLTVDAVTVDGTTAALSRDGQELTVTPRRRPCTGGRFTVDVRYHGVPEVVQNIDPQTGAVSTMGFMPTADGALVAGEPEVAATWFPVNDHPRDKASYSITLTVPDGLEAISNGILLDQESADGWTSWRWEQREPMASYLATAAIGEFTVTETDEPRPTLIAIDPALPAGLADDAVGRTNEIIAFLADRFGPYPFAATGAIVDDLPLGFALENQTRPIYGRSFFWTNTVDAETYVVAHELAHQWFGDSVSVANWSDIWLNEGFATYGEWLWAQTFYPDYLENVIASYRGVPADAPDWTVAPADPGVAEMFGFAVYNRGALTLHALRERVGDDTFFRITREWAAGKAGGNGSTAEFTVLAERLSGQDLDAFFDDWLYQHDRPDYRWGDAGPDVAADARPQQPAAAVR